MDPVDNALEYAAACEAAAAVRRKMGDEKAARQLESEAWVHFNAVAEQLSIALEACEQQDVRDLIAGALALVNDLIAEEARG